MKRSFIVIFWIVLAALCGCASTQIAPCDDVNVPKLKNFKNACRSEKIGFKEDGDIKQVDLLTVATTMRARGDNISPAYSYFLRDASGRLIALGDSRHFEDGYQVKHAILSELKIDGHRSGTLGPFDMSLFYDRRVEEVEGTYCVFYDLKPPFTGVVRVCGDVALESAKYGFTKGISNRYAQKEISKVGYEQGVLSWQDATDNVLRATFETVQTDRSNYAFQNWKSDDWLHEVRNQPRRDLRGDLYYLVLVPVRVRARPDLATRPNETPVERDYFLYKIDAKVGRPELIKRATDTDGSSFQALKASEK